MSLIPTSPYEIIPNIRRNILYLSHSTHSFFRRETKFNGDKISCFLTDKDGEYCNRSRKDFHTMKVLGDDNRERRRRGWTEEGKVEL